MPTDPTASRTIFLAAAELPDAAARAAYLDRGLRRRRRASRHGSRRCSAPTTSRTASSTSRPSRRRQPDHGRHRRPDRPRTPATPRRTGGDDRTDDEPLGVPGPAHPARLARPDRALRGARGARPGRLRHRLPGLRRRAAARGRGQGAGPADWPPRRRPASGSCARPGRRPQVRHENVVQVYEVEEQPLPYLVMEFIPGETLQQRLDRTGPLDVPEVLRIGRQIAEGLAAAHATRPDPPRHQAGQRPARRRVSSKVKITDFGLARAADDASISQSGIIAGTPMYMAPEQAHGHNARPAGRPVQPRQRALPDGSRPAAVPGEQHAGGAEAGGRGHAAADPRDHPRDAAVAVRHHREAARQEPGRPLPVGPGSGRRARRLRGAAQGQREAEGFLAASPAAKPPATAMESRSSTACGRRGCCSGARRSLVGGPPVGTRSTGTAIEVVADDGSTIQSIVWRDGQRRSPTGRRRNSADASTLPPGNTSSNSDRSRRADGRAMGTRRRRSGDLEPDGMARCPGDGVESPGANASRSAARDAGRIADARHDSAAAPTAGSSSSTARI